MSSGNGNANTPEEPSIDTNGFILNPILNGLSDDEIVERIAMEDQLMPIDKIPPHLMVNGIQETELAEENQNNRDKVEEA